MRRFLRRVQNTASTFDLWEEGESFIIGVSGGPDSLCLLDAMTLLQKKMHFSFHIAHVNYHLRGKDSNNDELLVRETAEKYSLPLTCFSCDTHSFRHSEETMRDLRYAFFEKTRIDQKAGKILIAHNQNDQAETLLMRLLRGSGLSGLSSMKAKNGHIIRPLIEMSRDDIMRYLQERNISFREDTSNKDVLYFRNQIRHILIPFLEQRFQPKIRPILAETALLLGEDYALLEHISTSFVVKETPTSKEFSCRDFLSLPPALMTRELRSLVRPLLEGKNPSKKLLGELLKVLKSTKNKTQTVTFQGLKFIRKGDTVRLLNF